MKTLLFISVLFLTPILSTAQIKNAATGTVMIYGNCAVCETAIEKAGFKKKLYKTDWNVDTKMATITYDSRKTGLDDVLKSIALSGYDNISYLAPEEAYAKLPTCCKYNRDKKVLAKTKKPDPKKEDMDAMDHSGHTTEKKTEEKVVVNPLTPVFDNYFAVKDALVKTDGATAAIKAAALYESLNSIKMESLGMKEHDAWMKVEAKLKTDTRKIKDTKDPADQREFFMSLSQNIYLLIKANPPQTIYYQYCPMANDGKGANWLSKESVIRNPYYGSQMLSCGNVAETIRK